MKNIAIFISGSGTNMEAIIKASLQKEINFNVILVISNKIDAKGIDKAKDYGIDTKTIPHKSYINRQEFEEDILKALQNYQLDLICLAGFMRLLTENFLKQINIPIINIHPSLLPKYKGANAIQDALDSGDKLSGCTMHYVTSNMDSGKIILQRKVNVLKNDNFNSLQQKIQKEEHIAYIEAIKSL